MPALSIEDIRQLIDRVRTQFYDIATRQMILDLLSNLEAGPHEDAHVYRHMWEMILGELRERGGPIFEQLLNQLDAESVQKRVQLTNQVEFSIRNTRVRVTVTHRGRAESVFGVDVVYDIHGRKVLGFQHKKATPREELPVDTDQLTKIKRLCPTCPEGHAVRHIWGPFPVPWYTPGYIQPSCTAIYVVNTSGDKEQRAVSACRYSGFREQYKKNPMSLYSLPPLSAVNEAFTSCFVGYDLQHRNESGRGPVDNMVDTLIQDDHLLFEVFFRKAG